MKSRILKNNTTLQQRNFNKIPSHHRLTQTASQEHQKQKLKSKINNTIAFIKKKFKLLTDNSSSNSDQIATIVGSIFGVIFFLFITLIVTMVIINSRRLALGLPPITGPRFFPRLPGPGLRALGRR
tara:strand:- start:2090 stop:2467 length:378 start_codon:yes stop_codon:yes gene_type:complete